MHRRSARRRRLAGRGAELGQCHHATVQRQDAIDPQPEGGGAPWQICMYVLFAGAVSALSAWLIRRGGEVAEMHLDDRPVQARP